jgi:transposase-like protein
MVNKHYPAQFKADAVALYRSRPGVTIASIADVLGINRETLRSWVRADDQQRGAVGLNAPPGRRSLGHLVPSRQPAWSRHEQYLVTEPSAVVVTP